MSDARRELSITKKRRKREKEEDHENQFREVHRNRPAAARLAELYKGQVELESDNTAKKTEISALRVGRDEKAMARANGQAWIDPTDLHRELAEVSEALEIHKRAVQIARERVAEVEGKDSARFCEKLQAKYDVEFGRPIAEAVRLFLRRNAEEIAFIDERLREGVKIGSLRRRCYPLVGLPQTANELLEAYLRGNPDL